MFQIEVTKARELAAALVDAADKLQDREDMTWVCIDPVRDRLVATDEVGTTCTIITVIRPTP